MYTEAVQALADQAVNKLAGQRRSLTSHVVRSMLAGMYVGAEADGKSLSLFGKDLENVKAHTSPAYVYNEWYDLSLEVDSNDNVVLLQNGNVTFTAHRTSRKPVYIAICAGDGYSPGHVEVSSVKLSAAAPKTGRLTAGVKDPSSPPQTP